MTNNLSYETAKKLLGAGFPFAELTEEEREHYGWGEREDCVFQPNVYEDDDEKVYYLPSLSELIDVCADKEKFFQLNYWPSKKVWIAEHPKAQGKGPTSIEAVANLYLALHNK